MRHSDSVPARLGAGGGRSGSGGWQRGQGWSKQMLPASEWPRAMVLKVWPPLLRGHHPEPVSYAHSLAPPQT